MWGPKPKVPATELVWGQCVSFCEVTLSVDRGCRGKRPPSRLGKAESSILVHLFRIAALWATMPREGLFSTPESSSAAIRRACCFCTLCLRLKQAWSDSLGTKKPQAGAWGFLGLEVRSGPSDLLKLSTGFPPKQPEKHCHYDI